VEDGDDVDSIWLHPVKDSIGEAAKCGPPDASMDLRIEIGKRLDDSVWRSLATKSAPNPLEACS
jgi:hypothetical protein